jgi:hypothetical protein
MAAALKKDEKKQVFDVAPPGSAVPSATSKPVIVGHGPMLKDPTIKSDDASAGTTADSRPASSASSQSKTIQPPSADTKAQEEIAATNGDTPDDSAKITDNNSSEPRTSIASNAIVDAVVGQATTSKQSLAESDYDREQVEQLIRDKTYFVKIHRPPQQSALAVVLWLLLIMVTAVTVVIIARGLGYVVFDTSVLNDFVGQ